MHVTKMQWWTTGVETLIRVRVSFLYQKQTRRTTQETNFLGYRRLNWRGGWEKSGVRNVAKIKGGGVAGAKE